MRFSRKKLFTAIRNRDFPFIHYYLEQGVDVNLTSKKENGTTPIEDAAYRNDTEICSLFLQYKPDLSKTKRLLFWAAYHSNSELFKLFVENNSPVEGVINECLLEACTRDNHYIAKEAIRLGANPNYKNRNITPLHSIASNGSLINAQLLVNNGANIELGDKYNRTPFQYALLDDNFEVVEYLYNKGANTDGVIQGKFAKVGSKEMLNFYSVLIENDPKKLEEFKNELHKRLDFLKVGKLEEKMKNYIFNDELESLKSLVSKNKNGININVGYEHAYMKNVTPLHLAIMKNNFEMVKFLIENGADINCITNRNVGVYSCLNFEDGGKEVNKIYDLLKKHEKVEEDRKEAERKRIKNYKSRFVESTVEKRNDGGVRVQIRPKKNAKFRKRKNSSTEYDQNTKQIGLWSQIKKLFS